METESDVLTWLVREPVALPRLDATLSALLVRLHELRGFDDSAALALAGGLLARSPGFAFAAGYQAAVDRLFGPSAGPAAFCATESGRAHPRKIQTHLVARSDGSFLLRGYKGFVTFGHLAARLLVVASLGSAGQDGHLDLRVVDLEPGDGCRMEVGPELPFLPEVPHAAVRFDDVVVAPDRVLPGDGYTEYFKPFRTVEDIHVQAALVGWMIASHRRCRLDPAALAELMALASTCLALARRDPRGPGVHLALEGSLRRVRALAADQQLWSGLPAEEQQRWRRDQALLAIAQGARDKRFAKAVASLEQPRATS